MSNSNKKYEERMKIYAFLDKNVVVTGRKIKILDISGYDNLGCDDFVSKLLGVEDILLLDWAEDNYGDSFCIRNWEHDTWFNNTNIHRGNDKPAVIYNNGTRYWYKNGIRHRANDKPAEINQYGDEIYYKNGKMHRDNDKPAYNMSSGTKVWYQNSRAYRINDQPTHEWSTGGVEWQSPNGQLHRLIGPAIIDHSGNREYWFRGIKLYVIPKYCWNNLDTKNNNRIFVPWIKKQ